MTIKEALEYWKFKYNRAKNFTDEHWEASERREHEEYVEALKIAVETLEKQIPKKPVEHIASSPVKIGNGFFGSGVKVHKCANCNGLIAAVHKCCYHCGQKIDWSENHE